MQTIFRNTTTRHSVSLGIITIAALWLAPQVSGWQFVTFRRPDNALHAPKACTGLTLGLFPCWLRKPLPGSDKETLAYYRGIGAIVDSGSTTVRDTLDGFKARNGFGPNSGDVEAVYFNEGDLRLGRDMHCRQNGLKVACFVANYGEQPFDPFTATPNARWPNAPDALALAIGGASGTGHPFATVAMEYSPAPTEKFVNVREKDGATANRFPTSSCPFVGNIGDRTGIPGVDVDTGIDVEPGDTLTFSAAGAIWAGYCLIGDTPANGYGDPDAKYPLPTAPGFAIIGRVGNGDYFYIGDGTQIGSLPVRSSGRLFLRTNDDTPGNGSGSFSVSVKVNRQDVKFYVYDDADRLVDAAALDQEGFKPVPQMCMSCHGGRYDSATHRVTNASFLPFDLANFIFSNDPRFTRSAQEEKFRQLNALVKRTSRDPNSAIAEMIDYMYVQTNASVPASVDIPGTAMRDGMVTTVQHWWDDANDPQPFRARLYQSFVRPYCRSCHVAARSGLEFNSYDQFEALGLSGALNTALCQTAQMPHAQVPYERLANALFDDVIAARLRALGVSCLGKNTPPPASAPRLTFADLCSRFPDFPRCTR